MPQVPPQKRLTVIFFDLDETLIHATDQEAPPGSCPFGPYHVILRPCAREMLAISRSRCKSTLLCTTATHDYAYGISELFGLGFRRNEILGLEHLFGCSPGIAAQSVLIDNLPATSPSVQFKAEVLGISANRILEIKPFHGGEESNDAVLLPLHRFLAGFVS